MGAKNWEKPRVFLDIVIICTVVAIITKLQKNSLAKYHVNTSVDQLHYEHVSYNVVNLRIFDFV